MGVSGISEPEEPVLECRGVNLWQDEKCCAPDDDVLTTFVIECIANMHHQLKYDFYKRVITSECRII